MKGLDANFGFGKDIYHKSENEYFGIALTGGISLPWIDSKKDSSNNDSLSSAVMNAMKKSRTKIYTYKIGLGISARYPLNRYFSIYGTGRYDYQTGKMKNDYVDADIDADGIFQEYDVGLRFQPVAFDKKIGWFTLSPRLFATLGYRYSDWKLRDIAIDVTGANVNFPKTDFEMDSSIWYFGFGYSF